AARPRRRSRAGADVGRSPRNAAGRRAAVARAGDGALGRIAITDVILKVRALARLEGWPHAPINFRGSPKTPRASSDNGEAVTQGWPIRESLDHASLRSGSPLNQASMPSTIWP